MPQALSIGNSSKNQWLPQLGVAASPEGCCHFELILARMLLGTSSTENVKPGSVSRSCSLRLAMRS
jgi:hypothetical protein